MRKGQIEVMGLTVIVIIIVILSIMFLRFYIVYGGANEDNTNFILSQKANNLANSLRGLEVCNSNMQEAIISCCNGDVFCSREACGYVSENVGLISNLSLEEPFIFEAKDLGGKSCVIYISKQKCGSYVSSSPSYIKSNKGEAEILVKLCKK